MPLEKHESTYTIVCPESWKPDVTGTKSRVRYTVEPSKDKPHSVELITHDGKVTVRGIAESKEAACTQLIDYLQEVGKVVLEISKHDI